MMINIAVEKVVAKYKNNCFHADNDDMLRTRQCVLRMYRLESNEIASMQILRVELNAISICVVSSEVLEWANIICVCVEWMGE